MRKLLALLLLLVSPAAYAQVDFTDAVNVPNIVVNPTMDNCVSGPSACGAWMESGSTLGNWVGANSNGGAVAQGKQYTFSYMQGTLYQNIDLSQYATNAFIDYLLCSKLLLVIHVLSSIFFGFFGLFFLRS